MKNTTRVVIAEDHAMIRQSMVNFIHEHIADILVIGEAGNGEELLQLLNSRQPDLVLMDLNMPVMHGAVALEIIKTRFPDIKIIIISSDFSPFLLNEYTKKGIHGFIPKGCDIEILVKAIRDVQKNGDCLTLSKSLIKKNVSYQNQFKLTEKEIKVLSLTCKGSSNKEIGTALDITESTVEFHKTNIYTKTGFKSLAQIISYGIKSGLDVL